MKNPDKHPQNFDDLPQGASVLRSMAGNKDQFRVPEQYFETFPDKLQHLLLLKKGTDFKVEESYFESFPDKIKTLTLQQKNEHAPMPTDAYFESFPRRVQDKIHEGKSQPSPLIPRLAWGGFALAACVVLAIMIIKPFQQEIHELQPTKQLAQLSKQEIYQVAENESFDEAVLMEEVSSLKDDTAPASPAEEQVSEDHQAIADYLLEQNIDLNTLVNEL
jgi:hypothetical protein